MFIFQTNPLRFGPYKILARLSEVTYGLLSQDGNTFHTHRNHFISYYPKERHLYPHIRKFMRFSDAINLDIPKNNIYANGDTSPFISEVHHRKMNLLKPLFPLILILL